MTLPEPNIRVVRIETELGPERFNVHDYGEFGILIPKQATHHYQIVLMAHLRAVVFQGYLTLEDAQAALASLPKGLNADGFGNGKTVYDLYNHAKRHNCCPGCAETSLRLLIRQFVEARHVN